MERSLSLSGAYHQSSKKRKMIPIDPTTWPPEWNTIHYKEYARLPSTPLRSGNIRADLPALLQTRKSGRTFSGKPLTMEQVSDLLGLGCGMQEARPPHRTYPSAGGRYPLEVYLTQFKGAPGLPAGLYHFNPKGHSLETLLAESLSPQEGAALFTYPWAADASAAIFLTAIFARNQSKYGERGYRQILLEAGHVGQNLYLLSLAHGISCCALTGTNDEKIEALLDIDGVTESLVYAFLLG